VVDRRQFFDVEDEAVFAKSAATVGLEELFAVVGS
jgi:hypothetical protein